MGAAASTAYRLGQETSGSASVGAGLSGVASAAGAAARQKAADNLGLSAAAERGQRAALFAGAVNSRAGGGDPPDDGQSTAPGWARQLRSEQAARHHRQVALHAIREGDRGGASANPDIKEKE